MERKLLDLWVGIFVVLGILALFGLSMKVTNLYSSDLGDTYGVTVSFGNIGGLRVRAPVKSAGVLVGRVTEIHLNTKTYDADVTLELSREYRFPKDTFASIRTSGLLGEQYIGLSPGADPEFVADGGKFQFVQNALVLEELIGKFFTMKSTEGISQNKSADAESNRK